MNGLDLWHAVEATDPKYTKKIEGREFGGDTVNLTYTTKKLTEVLGPAGDRWGWEVIDERVHEYGSHEHQNFTAIHAVRVRLWVRREDGSTGHIEDYGTTKLAYYAGRGNDRYLKVDEEACKKSLSDAKSKLFVALGGSAQVWLGEFDRTQHKYVGRDDDRPARAPRPAAPASPAAPRQQQRPAAGSAPHEDVGEARYNIEGYDVSAKSWIEDARRASHARQGQALLEWWAGYRDTRAAIYKRHEAHRAALAALSVEIKERAGQRDPADLLRAG